MSGGGAARCPEFTAPIPAPYFEVLKTPRRATGFALVVVDLAERLCLCVLQLKPPLFLPPVPYPFLQPSFSGHTDLTGLPPPCPSATRSTGSHPLHRPRSRPHHCASGPLRPCSISSPLLLAPAPFALTRSLERALRSRPPAPQSAGSHPLHHPLCAPIALAPATSVATGSTHWAAPAAVPACRPHACSATAPATAPTRPATAPTLRPPRHPRPLATPRLATTPARHHTCPPPHLPATTPARHHTRPAPPAPATPCLPKT
ncbi:hypothetical protein DFH08DRAFT_979713 [Mycena albidolilacea]|uniref:Uncharacterized protein n=1 Tax=Mycena albidolilacea TaxID=1033008 RepID=A0AAD6YWL6_9AGAR|nr:hypothetical protein DFH08DRAFT_979713 [Mycena albidolilacea]